MKGLYYCDWFEAYTANLARAVATHSHSVTVMVRESAPEFQDRATDARDLRQNLRKDVDHLAVVPGRYWSLKSFFQIQKILRRDRGEGYDYFHLQQTGDPRFLWTAFRLPTIVTLHEPKPRPGYYTRRNLRTLSSHIVLRAYRVVCAGIVVHTQGSFDGLAPREKKKATVIPHGVSAAVLEQPAVSKTILFFGRSQEYKGIDTLIAAMKEVWESEPEARLRILASPADDQCRYDVPDSRVSATWDGYSDSELKAALASARAVCLPYWSSRGSGAGTDAHGSGKPIVASDLEGLRELVSDKELLVQPGDVADLARALLVVLRRDCGTQRINPDLTWPNVASKHVDTYLAAIRRRRRTRL